jgi:energy-coupling factor transporter ATP-binding protein EcfA2
MPTATPAFATVRPRVVVATTGDSRLLDEVIAELAEELSSGLVRITGSSGSGKSTALNHVAAICAHDERMIFLDEPTQEELDSCPDDRLVVATMLGGAKRGIELTLEPWGQDELIEYLLHAHRDACSSVIARLGPAAHWTWMPEVACIVLERFVSDKLLNDPHAALMQHVREQLSSKKLNISVERYCLAVLIGRGQNIETSILKLLKAGCPHDVRKLVRHEMVQLPLAAECLMAALADGKYADLQSRLPVELIELVGRRLQMNESVLLRLSSHLHSSQIEAAYGMAASLLLAADR